MKQKKRHPGGMMPPRPLRKLKPLTPMMGPMGPVPHRMPVGGTLTPSGDLGELRQLEALKVFPDLQKMTDHVKRPSRKIPLKEPFAK